MPTVDDLFEFKGSNKEYLRLKALMTEGKKKTMTVASVTSVHCNSQTSKMDVILGKSKRNVKLHK
jgi:hypothetical protein